MNDSIFNVTTTTFPFVSADNFSDFNYNESDVDLQGWGGDHYIFSQVIQNKSPKTVCDVGVWKGQSTINMAQCLLNNNIQGQVFAVDTFLGNPQMWYREGKDHRQSLKLIHGFPSFYYTFLANLFHTKVENIVVPVVATTNTAYLMFSHSNIKFDLIHIDAAHEYQDVKNDIQNYWNLLNPGGTMICDDYSLKWPGVAKAVDEFVYTHKLNFENHENKAVIYK